jgi:ribosome-binding protein aMBF1 (putative translation factor)
MKLLGLHHLGVTDIRFLNQTYLVEAEDDEKDGQPGNVKNVSTPVGKVYTQSGLSQDKIADKVGVDPSTVSRYKHSEAGRRKGLGRRPSFDTLKKLTKVVGARASKLFPELG